MRYLPLTTEERTKILALCGVKDFNELIDAIPDSLRVKGLLDLESSIPEADLIEHVASLASKNQGASMKSFLGQGVYQHTWPRVIDQICNRGEFLTAYTPYQPEISQGTLQMIFEYQSLVSDLLGCEVSNASLYDGATSIVEGILMAARLKGLKSGRVLISEGTYARYREVIKSYLEPLGFELEVWRANPKTFTSTVDTLPSSSSQEPIAAVVLQSPNTWGLIEDWNELSKAATQLNTLSVGAVAHAHSCSIFEAPGHAGVDIVTAEAQSLGIPAGFGGPHLGVICCRKKDVRQMPGRIVGSTEDAYGNRSFCITLATREQHIRREKATSNICSNQNLMALRACLYMTLMGPTGMEKVAHLCRNLAWQARSQFEKALAQFNPDVKVLEGETLNEISLLITQKQILWADEFQANAEGKGLLAGVRVNAPEGSGFAQAIVLAFTERHKAEDIQSLIESMPGRNGEKLS